MDPLLVAGVAGFVTAMGSALGPLWSQLRRRRKLVDQHTLRITIDGRTIEIQSPEKKDLDFTLRQVLAEHSGHADDAGREK